MGEIEERRQFLADMAALGQGKKYVNIINTEISQVKAIPPSFGFIGRAVKPPLFRLLSTCDLTENSRTGDAGEKKQFPGGCDRI